MLTPAMRRGDFVFLAVILGLALSLRVWAPWHDVFGPTRVNFLENDAWYHIRLLENQVRNFPHHITRDPYAAPEAQYVAVAPLFDTIVATAVVLTGGTSASTAYIERFAALAPAAMGALAIVAVWALGTIAFGRREGLMAALLAAILPGHFLDRTLVGFVDHHALEAWLMFSTLAAMAWAMRRTGVGGGAAENRDGFARGTVPSVVSGVFLGLYLLGWTSGAMLVAIIGAWLIVVPFVATTTEVKSAATLTAVLSAVALVMVIAFQDLGLFRYSMQVVSLAGLLVISIGARALVARGSLGLVRVAILGLAIAAVVASSILAPAFTRQVLFDVLRLTPDATRMSVLEARPLFLYSGNWVWTQPWEFFRSGFYLGAVATLALAWSVARTRRIDHALIVLVTGAMFAATIGQNRFGYYLVPACAVVMGWLSARGFDWGGVPHADDRSPRVRVILPMQREWAVALVAGLAVAPNLVPSALTASRSGGMPDYWANVMTWLRDETPPPFSSDDYYLARYDVGSLETPAYTVMNWWDQGYWIAQAAHRVPAANPTQARAGDVARFYVATSEAEGLAVMRSMNARYAIADFELPFRSLDRGALGGRFENLVGWAGRSAGDFYQLCYSKSARGWEYTWLFREAYYQTMAYRLSVLGGAAATPMNNTWVVRTDDRVDAIGRHFCEVSERQVYPTAEAAKSAAQRLNSAYQVVGLTPWDAAFPVASIAGLRPVRDFRQPGQPPTEAPVVRIFEVVP
jgi:dolichyl-diphosphooligosaccharide--protein glycosyltransferase